MITFGCPLDVDFEVGVFLPDLPLEKRYVSVIASSPASQHLEAAGEPEH